MSEIDIVITDIRFFFSENDKDFLISKIRIFYIRIMVGNQKHQETLDLLI